MAKSSKKSTRKFEKTRLKGVLEKRNELKKGKQRHQLNLKKKAKRAKLQEAQDEDESESDNDEDHSKTNGDAFANMSLDEFFQGGFELPDMAGESKSKTKSEKTKKRKRNEDFEYSEEADREAEDDDSEESDADDFDTHKEDLEALAKKDPEFYKYLKENDAELLEFDELDNLELSSDESEEEDENEGGAEEGAARGETDSKAKDSALDLATVQKWRVAMGEQHSLRAMREAVQAFKAAVHLNDTDGKTYKYKITSPEVYHELLVAVLSHVPTVMNHHLPLTETSSGKIKLATSSKKFQTLSPVIKSHSAAIHHLLSNLSDAPTIKLTLNSVTPLLPYMLSLKKFLRLLVKTIVEIWSDPSTEEATRITAFLVVRKLVVIGDPGVKEAVLKTVYQGLISGCRKTSPYTLQAINMMKNTAAELWGLDDAVGYSSGFGFIRQLAIHLRGSITNNSKESYKTIYNWQYVHSLDFWSRVLSLYCDGLREAEAGKASALRPLIYPLVQITIGAMRLIPTAQYFPLRFQLVRSLLRISRTSGTYIPLAPALIEVLQSKELKSAAKSSTLRPLDFAAAIRAPKTYLRTRVYQDGLGEEAVELLSEFFAIWTKSIAFPELALPVTISLKRWTKDASRGTGNKNSKVNSAVTLLVQKLNANAAWIEERRAKIDFAPNNRTQVDAFLQDEDWEKAPLGAFVMTQRKLKAQREKLLEQSRRQERKQAEVAGDEMED